MTKTKTNKADLIKEFASHEKDSGSPAIQIALITDRIHQVSEHLLVHKNDESARRGLLKLVGQRRRMIEYIKTNSPDTFKDIKAKLDL